MKNLYVWNHGNYCEEDDMNEDVATEFGTSYQVITASTTIVEIMQMDSGIQVAISEYLKYK